MVYSQKTTHAVIGTAPGIASGVLGWYDSEWEAWTRLREIRNMGGKGRVVPAPAGELSLQDREEVWNLIVNDFRE